MAHKDCQNYLLQLQLSLVRTCILLSIASFWAGQDLSAQVTYKNITTKDGLADNTVYYMIQDHLGYLWIATESGVNRFDGVNFTHFTTKDGLGGNEILKMAMDSKNRIWFLSFNGVLSYYQHGKFHNPNNSELLAQVRIKASFTNMLEDKKGNIWFTSEIGHLIQLKNDRLIFHETTFSKELNIRQIWENERGEIFLGAFSGIYQLSQDYQSVSKINEHYFWSIQSFHFPNGSQLIPYKDGIIHSDDDNSLMFSLDDLGLDSKSTINNVLVTTFREALVVGTIRDGVYLYANSRAPTSGVYVNWLPNKSITSLLMDAEGALWVATLDDGLYRYNEGYDAIKYLGEDQGLDYSIIRSSMVAKDETIWFGGQDGSVYRFNKDGELLWKSKIDQRFSGWSSIEAIYESLNGEIFIGATDGLFKINYNILDLALQNGLNPHINEIRIQDYSSLSNITVKTITGNGNYIYVGNSRNLLQISLNEPHHIKTLAQKRITDLEFDNNGILWVGTVDGLMVWDGIELKYSGVELAEEVLIYDIDKLYGSWLAVSTYGNGLILMCTETNTAHQISEMQGLTSDLVRSTILDENGILWIGTNTGLNRVELDSNKTLSEQLSRLPIVTYTASDGLKNEQIIGIEGLNNMIWMSGTNGITMLKSSYLGFSPMNIPLIVESVSINNVGQTISKQYKVRYNQNQWGIKVAGIFLRDAPRLLYKYRISGLNDDWTITNNNYIHIQYLPPGEYLIEIETFTADGRITSDRVALNIVVNLPFWKQPLFLAFLFIALVSIIYYIVVKRIAWVRSEERKLIRVNQRINELEHQAIQAMIKPHTVFNLINSIRYHVIKNDSAKASELLMKFAKLIRIHLESTYSREIKLSEELERLHLFVDIEAERLENGITFNVEIDNRLNPDEITVPSLILHPFIENAIVHGIAPNKIRGVLSVKIEVSHLGQLIITVNDNGVGLGNMLEFEVGSSNSSNGDLHSINSARLTDGIGKSSMGLQLIMERVQLISRERELQWHLTIKNRRSQRGDIIGVTVIALLPLIVNSTVNREMNTVDAPV
jgi:ligand-binding sensor domain-containing protein